MTYKLICSLLPSHVLISCVTDMLGDARLHAMPALNTLQHAWANVERVPAFCAGVARKPRVYITLRFWATRELLEQLPESISLILILNILRRKDDVRHPLTYTHATHIYLFVPFHNHAMYTAARAAHARNVNTTVSILMFVHELVEREMTKNAITSNARVTLCRSEV